MRTPGGPDMTACMVVMAGRDDQGGLAHAVLGEDQSVEPGCGAALWSDSGSPCTTSPAEV